jgi:hypothetical protein
MESSDPVSGVNGNALPMTAAFHLLTGVRVATDMPGKDEIEYYSLVRK